MTPTTMGVIVILSVFHRIVMYMVTMSVIPMVKECVGVDIQE